MCLKLITLSSLTSVIIKLFCKFRYLPVDWYRVRFPILFLHPESQTPHCKRWNCRRLGSEYIVILIWNIKIDIFSSRCLYASFLLSKNWFRSPGPRTHFDGLNLCSIIHHGLGGLKSTHYPIKMWSSIKVQVTGLISSHIFPECSWDCMTRNWTGFV